MGDITWRLRCTLVARVLHSPLTVAEQTSPATHGGGAVPGSFLAAPAIILTATQLAGHHCSTKTPTTAARFVAPPLSLRYDLVENCRRIKFR